MNLIFRMEALNTLIVSFEKGVIISAQIDMSGELIDGLSIRSDHIEVQSCSRYELSMEVEPAAESEYLVMSFEIGAGQVAVVVPGAGERIVTSATTLSYSSTC
jgi:hypothetical protein